MANSTTKKLIKVHDMDPTMRGRTSDFTKIAIDERSTLRLVPIDTGDGLGEGYDTGDGHYIELPEWTVGAVLAWNTLQVVGTTPKDLDRQQVTSIRLRLHDGDDHYFWDGSEWALVADDSTSWNTLTEVNDHLADWDLDDPLGLVVNLKTTDRRYTPTLTSVKALLALGVVDYVEDWIYEGVIGALQDTIRPLSDVRIAHTGGATLSLSLGDYAAWQEAITAVEGVWNLTTDPKCRTNLYSSYNAGTRVVTLTGSQTSGDQLLVRFRYAPVVALQSSMDFEEDATVPALTFTEVDTVDMGVAAGDESVLDVASEPPSGAILPAPRRVHITFTMEARAPLAIDLQRLVAEVTTWLDTNKVLASPTTGEQVTMVVVSTFTRSSNPNVDDVHAATMSFRLLDVNNWTRPAIIAGEDSNGQGFGVTAVTVRTQVGATTSTSAIEEL